MAFNPGNQGNGPMADINVTPLVDVMLVLLIIFMITAPLMSHRVRVDLPEVDFPSQPATHPGDPSPINIAVKDNGNLFWNDEPVSQALLESRFSSEAQKLPQHQVNVRGDKSAKYRLVQQVVTTAQRQGMRKVGFVAIRERAARP